MRFLKIFVIAFFSLIGVLGLIVGGMYIFGALTPKRVDPESIYFEYEQGQSEYYLSADTNIKISTDTPDVTVKKITLSFEGVESSANIPDAKGFITNGIITVPQQVVLGQSFQVKLVKVNDWIKGGQSVLKASIDSNVAPNITTTINVDVPVKSITIKTYANYDFETQQCLNEKTSFPAGETFYAEAEFEPAESKYKYGLEELGTKNVIFTLDDKLDYINQQVCKDFALGKNNVVAFTAPEKINVATNIKGYVFSDIALEEKIFKEKNNNLDAILPELISSDQKVSQTQQVSFSSVSVDKISLTQKDTKNELQLYKPNKIYANYGSALNFGIEITGTDSVHGEQYLQSKIKDVKLKVLIKKDQYVEADYGEDYLFVKSNPNQEFASTDNPLIEVSNINRSYWNFVPLLENTLYAFVISISDDLKVATNSAEVNQTWQSSKIKASTVSWTDSTPITLTVVDSIDKSQITSEEFDLQTRLLANLGTYSTVQFIAYSEANVDLEKVIDGAKLNTNYINSAMGLNVDLKIYELNSSIIKLQPTILQQFNVRAVVLKTDYKNRLNGNREVLYYTPNDLVVNINKTVQNISVDIEVKNSLLIKNLPADEGDKNLTKLAFTPSVIAQNIFDFVFTVVCDSKEKLDFDKQIFLNDFNAKKIKLNSEIFGEQKSAVIFEPDEDGVFISDTVWQFRVHAYTTVDEVSDTQISFYGYIYEQIPDKTTISATIKSVSFADDSGLKFTENPSSVVVDIYDGKIYSLEYEHNSNVRKTLEDDTPYFGHLVTITNVQTSDETGLGLLGDEKAYVADKLTRDYKNSEDEIVDDVKDENGQFSVIAKDKYGNIITNPLCTYKHSTVIGEGECVTVSPLYYSSSLKNNQVPTDKLYFIENETLSSTTIRANDGKVQDGAWSNSKYIDYSTVDGEKEINITRYGFKGSEFDINRQNGLLSVLYKQGDKTYEFYNVLTYTVPNLSAYEGVIEQVDNDGLLTIKILKSLAHDVNLKITATSELGSEYVINLTIRQNIIVKLNRLVDQAELSEQNANNQFLLYSNNKVKYSLQVYYTCLEDATLYLNKGSFSKDDDTIKSNKFSTTDINNIPEAELYINFASSELGEQIVLLTTDSNCEPSPHEFVCELKFNVTPNIMFTNGNSITKNVTIDNNQEFKNILVQSELQNESTVNIDETLLKRIVGNEPINISDITLAFDKVCFIESGKQITNKMFELNVGPEPTFEKQIYLMNGQTLGGVYNQNGEYCALLTIKYGSFDLGTMKVNIGSSITPNYKNDFAKNRFVWYEGQIYLAFVGGENISLVGNEPNTEYIKDLFTLNGVQGEFDIKLDMPQKFASSNAEKNTFAINLTSKFITSTLNSDIVLTLTHKVDTKVVASIQFPVIIMPFGADYVNYQHQPNFDNKSVGTDQDDNDVYLTDISKLNNYIELNEYIKLEDMDKFACGTTISLFQSATQNYGFSQDVLNRIKNKSLKLVIRYAGQQGQITTVNYANQVDNDLLILNSSASDVVLYAVLFNQDNTQLGLYKFLAQKNVEIKVNYPFQVQGEDNCAEYVGKGKIDLNEKFSNEYPNYNKKRIELDYLTGEEVDGYSINYSIFTVDGKEIKTAYELANDYGLEIDGNNLLINSTATHTVVIKAQIMQHNLEVGVVYYTFKVNTPQTNFVLQDSHFDVYTEESKIIANGKSYDFGEILLYSQPSDQSSSTRIDGLQHYWFIVDDPQNTDKFITHIGNTLSLNNEKAVSTKVVKFVYYTVYGPVHTTILNFQSAYDYTLKTDDPVFTETEKDNYDVLADMEFKFADHFQAKKSKDESINLTNVKYYLDGATEGVNEDEKGKKLSFAQGQAGKTFTIKIEAQLEGKSLAENFVFTINLSVKKSISSLHETSGNAMKYGDGSDVVYNTNYKTNGLVFDKIFSDEQNVDALFKVESFDVLKNYKLRVFASNNCADFLSFSSSEEGKIDQVFDEKLFDEELKKVFDLTTYINRSPNKQNLSVEITFTLIKNGQSVLYAKLKFVVVPDVIVELNYPQPNAQSTLDYEARFLGASGDMSFVFASNNTYFGDKNRVVFKDRDNKPYSVGGDREVKIRATSTGAILLGNEGKTTLEFDIDDSLRLAWENGDTVQTLESYVLFDVVIDGVVFETYKITFSNNMNSLFSVSDITNLYNNQGINSPENPEIFYASSKSCEAIFSYNTVLLTFTSGNQEATLTAILKDSDVELGTINIGGVAKTYSWMLINPTSDSDEFIKQDLSNVIIKVGSGENEKQFALNSSNSYIFNPVLTYRLSLEYLGEKVDYNNMAELLEVDSTAISSYSPTLNTAVDKKAVEFSIDGESLLQNYYYSVVFDFVCNKDSETMAVGSTEESGNRFLGITTLNGGDFTAEYFKTKGVFYNAELAMITKFNFEQNPTMDNVLYASNSRLAILQDYFKNFTVTSKPSLYQPCMGVAVEETQKDSKRYFDFELTALGAENDGNYAYVLVTYTTDENLIKNSITSTQLASNKLTYALVKVLVKYADEDDCIVLQNTNKLPNSSNYRQVIGYNKNEVFGFEDEYGVSRGIKNIDGTTDKHYLYLGSKTSTSEDDDLIFVGTNDKNEIIAEGSNTDHQTQMILFGDIAEYAFIDYETIPGEVILQQKENTIARYGNKDGYILVKDMYGFEKRYYLRLEPLADNFTLSFPNDEESGVFVNAIKGLTNAYYSGTEMMVVDAGDSVTSSEQGGIRIVNFNQIEKLGWNYTIKYELLDMKTDEVLFTYQNDEAQNKTLFELPTLKDISKELTLKIVITVQPTFGPSEVVTLTTPIKIQKRFILTTPPDNTTASVQSGVQFSLNDYLTVQDVANTNVNLGQASMSGKTLTLLIDSCEKGKQIYISYSHISDETINGGFDIKAGEDFEGNEMTPVVIGDKEFFIYPFAKHDMLRNLDFDYYRFSFVNYGYGNPIQTSNCVFVADQMIYLSTSKLKTEETVYVKIQKDVMYYVPFKLNKNGTQEKSLVELVATKKLLKSLKPEIAYPDEKIDDVIRNKNKIYAKTQDALTYYSTVQAQTEEPKEFFGFKISTTPVSMQDLNKIKNFNIYDDNLVFKIKKGSIADITQEVDFSITVKDGSTILGSKKEIKPLHNFDHTMFISLYSIIGDKLNPETTYTIEIKVDSSNNTVAVVNYVDKTGTRAIYKETESQNPIKFKCKLLTTNDETTNKDTLAVDSIQAFSEGRIYRIPKSYIVEYMDQTTETSRLLESKSLNFNVTPRYYQLSNYQNESSARVIYANQYRIENGQIVVDFNTWANQFDLMNYAGDVLASLSNGKDLKFEVSKGAVIIENNMLKTAKEYSYGDEFIIDVKVKVVDDEYLKIGQIYIVLNRDYVYVTNLATYLIVIQDSESNATIDMSYRFNEKRVALQTLVESLPEEHYKDNEIYFTNDFSQELSKCNIEVITVVDNIYSAEYYYDLESKDELLQVKLKLNEISSTLNQTVQLSFKAKAGSDELSTDINFTAIEEENVEGVKEYHLSYEFIKNQSRDENTGVLTLNIDFKELFPSIVGEDYHYSVSIVSTGDTNSNYLYAKRDLAPDKIQEDTLFFAVSFFDENNIRHNTILAINNPKTNPQETELYKNDGYFTINLQNIRIIDNVEVLAEISDGKFESKISCCSITYLKGFSIEGLRANVNLLLSTKDDKTSYYAIGFVINYNDVFPFEISIKSDVMYEKLIAYNEKLNIKLYKKPVVNNLPSILELPSQGQKVYGLYTNNVSDIKIFAIKSEQETCDINLSAIIESLEGDTMMTLVDYSKLVYGNIEGPNIICKSKNGGNIFIYTSITQSDNLYILGDNPFKTIGGEIIVNNEINLAGLVSGGVSNGIYYNFVVQKPDNNFEYVAIKAIDDELIYAPTDTGIYTFNYQNVTNTDLISNPKVYYEIYKDNKLQGVKCVEYSGTGNILNVSSNIFGDIIGNVRAKQISSPLSLAIDNTQTYYITTTLNGEKTYYVAYKVGSVFDKIQLNLNVNEFMEITISTTNFANFAGNKITLFVQTSGVDQHFTASWEGGSEPITVVAGNESVEVININTGGKNLTIQA